MIRGELIPHRCAADTLHALVPIILWTVLLHSHGGLLLRQARTARLALRLDSREDRERHMEEYDQLLARTTCEHSPLIPSGSFLGCKDRDGLPNDTYKPG